MDHHTLGQWDNPPGDPVFYIEDCKISGLYQKTLIILLILSNLKSLACNRRELDIAFLCWLIPFFLQYTECYLIINFKTLPSKSDNQNWDFHLKEHQNLSLFFYIKMHNKISGFPSDLRGCWGQRRPWKVKVSKFQNWRHFYKRNNCSYSQKYNWNICEMHLLWSRLLFEMNQTKDLSIFN